MSNILNWDSGGITSFILKGQGNETDFLGFLHKSVPHESLTLPFEPFRYWLRIREDIPIRKTTPHITDTESQLLIFLTEISLYRWYGESSTPRTSDTVSRRLPVSLSRRVTDSAYHRYGESTTPRIVESGSRRLRGSVIRGVAIQRKN